MEWSRASYRKWIWKFSISTFLCNNLEKILINVSAIKNITRKPLFFINFLYNFFQVNVIIKNRNVILNVGLPRVLVLFKYLFRISKILLIVLNEIHL
jgi:hypothetical protein